MTKITKIIRITSINIIHSDVPEESHETRKMGEQVNIMKISVDNDG